MENYQIRYHAGKLMKALPSITAVASYVKREDGAYIVRMVNVAPKLADMLRMVATSTLLKDQPVGLQMINAALAEYDDVQPNVEPPQSEPSAESKRIMAEFNARCEASRAAYDAAVDKWTSNGKLTKDEARLILSFEKNAGKPDPDVIADMERVLNEPTPPPPQEEIRVRFKRTVDRYPHALIAEGETGTYIGHRMGEDAVRLDRHCPELDEWNNCVMWYDESVGFNGYVWDDVEPIDTAAVTDANLCERCAEVVTGAVQYCNDCMEEIAYNKEQANPSDGLGY